MGGLTRDISIDTGAVTAFGFEMVEPSSLNVRAPFVDSTLSVTVLSGAANIGSFSVNPPNDVAAFIGVRSDQPFDAVQVREIVGADENEFFGEFFISGPAPTTTITTFSDKADFISATGSVSASGPIPLLSGTHQEETLGSITIAQSEGFGAVFGPDFSPLLPGNEIATSGDSDFDISIDTGLVTAFGFEMVEPTSLNVNAPFVDSILSITLLDGPNGIASFSVNPPNDVAAFIGVQSGQPFDVVQIREIVGADENEFFGEFFFDGAPPVVTTVETFDQEATFLAATGATAEPENPNSPLNPASDLTIGNLTFSAPFGFFSGTAGVLKTEPDLGPQWSTVIPGNEIAINGPEDLNIESVVPLFSLGFQIHSPTLPGGAPDGCFVTTCLDTTFGVQLFIGETPLGFTTFNPVNDALAYFGVSSTAPFDHVEIRDLTAGGGNVYFGRFFTSSVAIPEPPALGVIGLGLLLIGGASLLSSRFRPRS